MTGKYNENLKDLIGQSKFVEQIDPRELSQRKSEWDSIKEETVGSGRNTPVKVINVRSADKVQSSDEESITP